MQVWPYCIQLSTSFVQSQDSYLCILQNRYTPDVWTYLFKLGGKKVIIVVIIAAIIKIPMAYAAVTIQLSWDPSTCSAPFTTITENYEHISYWRVYQWGIVALI